MKRFLLGVVLCVSLPLVTNGCHPRRRAVAPSEAPAVPVSHPVQANVTDFVDFTGRTDAVEAVDIRPRVTGYLTKMPFKEGKEVKKDDLLFEIDPRPHKAQLDQAMSQVNLYKAAQKLAETTYARDLATYTASTGAVSMQQLDQDRAAVEEAAARVRTYEAMMEVYKLNLELCQVVSPIDGRISRYYLTRGNLVNQDQTLLTTVVSLNPIYAYFDLDEPTFLMIRRAIDEGTTKRPGEGEIPVFMRLQGEEGFPHEGRVNFVNNQVNPTTGSVVLVGLACKNAILIVEFAHQQQDRGVLPRWEATVEACRLRLRPILMTSFAFILGVVPLVIATGAGAEMRRALGTAVFSGMLGVTMFGNFLTPVFYYALQWFGKEPARREPAVGTSLGGPTPGHEGEGGP
jgi:RND family efflux transporter MFP subunit